MGEPYSRVIFRKTHALAHTGDRPHKPHMEGFQGILKRERHYGKCFTGRQELIQMIQHYIRHYNTRRLPRNPGILTPPEKHLPALAA